MASVRKCKIVGIRKITYTKNGETFNAGEYHFTYQDPDIKGIGVGSVFLRDDALSEPIDPAKDFMVFHNPGSRYPFTYIPDQR